LYRKAFFIFSFYLLPYYLGIFEIFILFVKKLKKKICEKKYNLLEDSRIFYSLHENFKIH